MGFFDVWKDALLKPFATFEKMKKGANLMDGLKHLVVAGVIAGVITAIVGLAAGALVGGSMGSLVGGFGLLAIIVTPIVLVIGWLIDSVILFIFAKLLGGKGTFTTQSYLLALYLAPIVVIITILGLIPLAGALLNLLVGLWSLYLLTMALKSAHGFDTLKAALTWIIPIVLVFIIALILGVALLGTILGSVGMRSLAGV